MLMISGNHGWQVTIFNVFLCIPKFIIQLLIPWLLIPWNSQLSFLLRTYTVAFGERVSSLLDKLPTGRKPLRNPQA